MPPTNPHSLPLTLIVATTPIRVASPAATAALTQDQHEAPRTITRLGIGLNGTLPWPRIKADMSFFARATSRPPKQGTTNAIIMGRKTYESVPVNLRPLAKRISTVVTRDQSGAVREKIMRELEAKKSKMAAKAKADAEARQASGDTETKPEEPMTDAIVTSSLDAAVADLEASYGAKGTLGKIWVIGGAEIYGAALRLGDEAGSQLKDRPIRIVMTNVVRKPEATGVEEPFECDTFFPLDADALTAESGWRSASPSEVSEWVGEEVSGEWKREGDIEVQMVGYERTN